MGTKLVRADQPDPWLDRLAWLMDRSIPIGRWRIGLDPLLGLIPGVGDYLSSIATAVIIGRAASIGLPRGAVARMLVNALLDTLLGSVPVVGDLFDAAFKANTRNMEIFREAIQGRRHASRDWAFVVLILLALGAMLAVPAIALVYVFKLV